MNLESKQTMNYNRRNSVNCLIAIEKTTLSTLILDADSNKINEAMSIIDENDFYNTQNGLIYKSLITQFKKDMPIDENTVFLSNENKIDEEYYIDVIATTTISEITNYLKQIKTYSIKRQIKLSASKLKNGDMKEIDKINTLQRKLKNLDNFKDLKEFDNNFEYFISKYDLDPNKINAKKIEYLFDGFIVKNDFIMIVSRPGLGKSFLLLSVCNMLLEKDKIKRIIYLDGDNSEITIKNRNIHKLKERYTKRLNYIVEKTKADYTQIINELKKTNLTDCLVVFDSIKNFLDGDRNNHKDVTDLLSTLKILRKNGATVIFLHHQNKLNKDFNSAFAGSSAFTEDVSLAFELKKNEDKGTYILIPLKDRDNSSSYLAFKYNSDNTLTQVDVDYALETNEELEIKEEIIRFLKSSSEKPTYSVLLNSLVDIGYNKDKSNKIIQVGKNKIWKATRIAKKNNRLEFELLDSQDKQDKSKKKAL